MCCVPNTIVQINLASNLPLAHWDEVLIESVLVNLIDNATRYSEPGSPLEICGEALSAGIAIVVADRGRGLLPGDEHHVFEMFRRGADAKPDRWGTGLGLAICKAIVKAHGGVIEARRRPGGGTVIRFTIPHDQPPPALDLVSTEQANQ